MRQRGTNRAGRGFDDSTILQVWSKGRVVAGRDGATWRLDRCGALMRFEDYGDTSSNTGWEIDHDRPVAEGGGDNLGNLQPLQWQNNRGKADAWPSWGCSVRWR